MPARDEHKLYGPCRRWLADFLRQRFPRTKTGTLEDTDRQRLRDCLHAAGLSAAFPESAAWEVKVDVVGYVWHKRNRVDLVFVELKWNPVTLADLGQLLGYCRICRPTEAFLLSPQALSGDFHRLLVAYGRTDVLEYDRTHICVGKWNRSTGAPDWGALIPSGLFKSCGRVARVTRNAR